MGKSKRSGKKKKKQAGNQQSEPLGSPSSDVAGPVVNAPDNENITPLVSSEESAPTPPSPTPETVVTTYYETPADTPAPEAAPHVQPAPPVVEAAVPISVPTEPRGAAIWRRLGATGYDLLFVAVLCVAVVGTTIGWMFLSFAEPLDSASHPFDPSDAKHYLLKAVLICVASVWLYSTLLETWWLGATIGKLIFHLRVTDLDGKPISFRRANIRFLSKFVTGATFGIGMLSGLFKYNRQTLHDRLSKTLVIRR